jgi:hypothetical protein
MLLIVITVAAAVLMYAYTSGLMGRLQGAAVHQPYLEQVEVDYYDWTTITNGQFSPLKITVRNVGVATAVMSDFFISGTKVSGVQFDTNCPQGSIIVKTSCVVILLVGFTATAGYAYSVRIATQDGAVFAYSCIAGQSTGSFS